MIIRRAVCCDTHRDKDDKNVKPDCKVGKISKFLECSDLTKDHSNQWPNEHADGEAKLHHAHLGQCLPAAEDNDSDVKKKLNALQNVHAVAGICSVDSVAQVAKGSHGIPVRVEF